MDFLQQLLAMFQGGGTGTNAPRPIVSPGSPSMGGPVSTQKGPPSLTLDPSQFQGFDKYLGSVPPSGLAAPKVAGATEGGPSVAGAPPIGSQFPQFNLPTPSLPPAAGSPNPGAATQANPFQQLLERYQAIQQQQLQQRGFNFKEHPIKSILNAIAAMGQGFASGFHGQESPWQAETERLSSPAYPLGLATAAMRGQTEGQMVPLEMQHLQTQIGGEQQRMEESKVRTAGEQQRQKQEMATAPLERAKIQSQIQENRKRAQYYVAAAQKAQTTNPQNAAAMRQLASMYTYLGRLQNSKSMTFNKAQIAQLDQQIADQMRKIQDTESALGLTSTGAGGPAAAQPGTEQQIPTGSDVVDFSQLP